MMIRWSKIAQHLPGRTDNEVKNYWRTRVQKQAKQLNLESNSQTFLDAVRSVWTGPGLLHIMDHHHHHHQTPSDSADFQLICSSSSSSSSSSSQQLLPVPAACNSNSELTQKRSSVIPVSTHDDLNITQHHLDNDLITSSSSSLLSDQSYTNLCPTTTHPNTTPLFFSSSSDDHHHHHHHHQPDHFFNSNYDQPCLLPNYQCGDLSDILAIDSTMSSYNYGHTHETAPSPPLLVSDMSDSSWTNYQQMMPMNYNTAPDQWKTTTTHADHASNTLWKMEDVDLWQFDK